MTVTVIVLYREINLYIVYFRIFDTDQNKKVDEKDLQHIMKLLFGNRMSPEDVRTLTEKIFEEADTGAKGYLDYDDI